MRRPPAQIEVRSLPQWATRGSSTLPVAFGCMMAVVLATASAQTSERPDGKRRFEVPGGEAESTLRQFMTQAGVQLLVSTEDIRGVTTRPVHGMFTPLVALRQMLDGTSLIAREDRNTGAIAVLSAVGVKKDDPAHPNRHPRSKENKPPRARGAEGPAIAPAAQAQSPPTTEEVLRLDDFTVTTDKVTGYRATNSITATGVGMPIGDTPITIHVVPKDLIFDSQSELIIDTLRFVPGAVSSPTNESQPSIRGFLGTYSLRNGVFRRQNLTTWNVERVEVIQGSSSIFYSNIRPGGIINYITTKPELGRTFADVEMSVGTRQYFRSQAAFNVAAGSNFAVRLVLGRLDLRTFRREHRDRQDFFSVSALWKITPNQQLLLETGNEKAERENSWTMYVVPLTNSRYWKNPAAMASNQSVATFMAANFPSLPRFDMFAPFAPRPDDPYGRATPLFSNSFQSTTNHPVDVTYNAKITDHFALSVVGNYAYENNQGLNPFAGNIYADGTFRNATSELFINIRESWNLNTRLTGRFERSGMKHTLMVGNDNQWVVQRYPQVDGILNQHGATIAILDPRTTSPDARALSLQSPAPFNSVRRTLQFFGGSYFVDQCSLLNDTVFIVAGARYVDFKQQVSYRATTSAAVLPAAPPDAVARRWTPQAGILYKVGGGVAIFGNYSESIIPQTQVDASGATVKPIEGSGYDLGAKLQLLGGALTGTIDYFSIQQTNTAVSDAERNLANGLPATATYGYYTYGNAQKVRGLQMDLNYSVQRDLQLVASWNHLFQAENVAPQSDPRQIGVPISYQPKNAISIWTKYSPASGALSGFSIGGGIKYNSAASLGGSFDTASVGIPAFVVVDALLGYRLKIFERPIQVRLTAKNLFNKIYRESAAVFASDRRIVLSVSTQF